MRHGKPIASASWSLSKSAAEVRLCEGGELFYYIKQRKYLKESEAALIMRQALSAIKYCHDHNICHRYVLSLRIRDLKPENFLLQKADDLGSIKLIDFGLS